jgi:hypothetical protein
MTKAEKLRIAIENLEAALDALTADGATEEARRPYEAALAKARADLAVLVAAKWRVG